MAKTQARFFVEPMARPRVPVEALLAQIEMHVRLEQAAAELFISTPTQDQLHKKTNSPFVN